MTILIEKLLQLPIEKDSGHIVVLAGGAGSGKSFSIRNFTNVTDFSKVIDVDRIRELVIKSDKLKQLFFDYIQYNFKNSSFAKRFNTVDTLNSDAFKDSEFNSVLRDFVSEKKFTRNTLKSVTSSGNTPNIVIDGTSRNVSYIENTLQNLYNNGYTPEKTHYIFVYASVDKGLERNEKRSRSVRASFVSSSNKSSLEVLLKFLREYKLPLNITGSLSIINNNNNDKSFKYYTVMKDGKWFDNKISDFLFDTKIVDRVDESKSVRSITNEPFDSYPSVTFEYFSVKLGITQSKSGKFVLYKRENNKLLPLEFVEGLVYIIKSSSTLEQIEDKLTDITFVKNISSINS